MSEGKTWDIERLFGKIRTLEVHTPQGTSGLLAKESRYSFNYAQVSQGGVQGSGPGSPSVSRPTFRGCMPSTSLSGSIAASALS